MGEELFAPAEKSRDGLPRMEGEMFAPHRECDLMVESDHSFARILLPLIACAGALSDVFSLKFLSVSTQ